MDDWRGRWVAVNFFASWCTPCIQEHPELVAFDAAPREAGDAAVGSVTYDDRTDDAKEFFAKRGGDWPVVDDPENSIGVAYGVARDPAPSLVARNDIVHNRPVGVVPPAPLDQN